MSFTPLHVHTEHSSLDGLARIKDIPHAAAQHGFTACALTDHGTPAGLWTFAQESKKAGVKPIAGIEVYLAIGSRHDPQTMEVIADDGMGDADDEVRTEGERRTKTKSYYHLTVLARNRTGWHNLIRFHNESQKTKRGKHPLGDWELLKKYGDGLILLTGCLASPVAGPLAQTQFYEPDSQEFADLIDDAHTAVDHMIEAVGAENVFVEVMDHGIASENHAMEMLFDLAAERELDVVATNDSHYMDCDDDEAHEAFLAVGTGKSLEDQSRFKFNGSGYHFKSEDEMRDVHRDWDEWQAAIDNTQIVADLVAADTVPEPEIRLPKFDLPAEWGSADDYLRHLAEDGAVWRYGDDWQEDAEVVERIDHELSVVSDMGYSDYFLITWDMIEYARSQQITTGPGRGSAGGSILAHLLGITGLCPLRYDLLFERFLERGRVGMPDIDMDFPKHKRHLIHRYCVQKYGIGHVAHIGGFNKAQTKAAIKDAARVLTPAIDKKLTAAKRDELQLRRKVVFKLGDTLAKTIEYGENKSQSFAQLDEPSSEEETLRANEFWAAVDAAGQTGQRIVELARRFEGVSKNETIHPCGFVISDEPLFDMVPLRPESKDATEEDPMVIVWDGDMVEDFGLLKMDFLGIQNLDYIDLTFEYLTRRGVEGLPQSIEDIPDPDGDADGTFGDDVEATYRMLTAGRTAGIFQLDSAGMTKVVQDIRPENLNDLSAAVALYRPGPISADMPEDYAARKHGRREESYDHLTFDADEADWLGTVLGETFQTCLYQEQAMQLGQVVAGFDDIQRSTLRKAIGKKKQDLMDQCSDWWFSGYGQEFEKNGELISPVFSKQTSQNVWDFIKGAAEYSFNKCVTGETVIETGGGRREWTVESLYRALHGDQSGPGDTCPYCWERPARPHRPEARCPRCVSFLTQFRDPERGLNLLAADSKDGRIRPQRVKDVHFNGVRRVYRVELADGRSVRATENHRFMADDGSYIRVDQITPGESALATDEGQGHLMGSSVVVSIRPDGEEPVYDVEMADGTDHNFVANGTVSHNSHSAAYGMLAYWTAYLKANYPVEYAAAMLATSDNDEKRLLVLADLKAEGIEICAPGINESDQHTVPADGRVMLGLGEVKDVGKAAAAIIAEREAGAFASLHDVASRVKGITVTALRGLIDSGAFDEFGPRRGLLKTLYAAKKTEVAPVGEDFGVVERDRRQRAVLGTVIGSVTLDHIDLAEVGEIISDEAEDAVAIERLDDLAHDTTSASHLGVVSDYRTIISRRGRMAKMVIEDTSSVEAVIFPDSYRDMTRSFGAPQIGDLVVTLGSVKLSTYGSSDGEAQPRQEIIADRVFLVDDPTWVEDQPQATSQLVDALEQGHPRHEDRGDEGEPNEPAEDETEIAHSDVPDHRRPPEQQPDDPGSWTFVLVDDELHSGLSLSTSSMLYIEGVLRESPDAVVDRDSPIHLDRSRGVAVKLITGSEVTEELAQLKAAAGA